MTLSKFEHVKITGISVVVPKKEINIYDEAEYYDNSIKKIDRMRKMVGFWKRRVVDEDVTASDLSIQAAETLIKDMNIDKDSIDCLIYVVQRPDYSAPATAFYIHNKLNLSYSCAAADIHQGCPGWVYGLWTASQMIESKACKRILLLVGDTPSAGMDLSNRISAPVFGDGGVATLVEYSEDKVLSYYNVETQSKDFEAIINPASGARLHFKRNDDKFNAKLLKPIKTPSGYETKLSYGYMDGLAVFDFTINQVPKSIKKLMEYADITPEETEKLLLHQANKQIVQAVAAACGYPEEQAPYDAFENFGNNTMCSIPTTINYLYANKLNKDSKFVCSAFGNGLAVATALLKLSKDIYLSGVQDFIKPKNHPTSEDLIKYWTNKLEGNSKKTS